MKAHEAKIGQLVKWKDDCSPYWIRQQKRNPIGMVKRINIGYINTITVHWFDSNSEHIEMAEFLEVISE